MTSECRPSIMLFITFATVFTSLATGALSGRQTPSGVPQFALDYAPMVYLYTDETYFPSDIGAQVANTQPELNYTLITNSQEPLTLDNLNSLSALAPVRDIYLTSQISPEARPAYLEGVVPDSSGKTQSAVSCAVVVNDHGSGLVDVFYFYFYAFNWGGFYFGQAVDLHVGDWEHTMTRFANGTPTDIWFSQHSNGEAFTYAATEKYQGGLRPVIYSANGSHANYALEGTHDHTIPDFNLPAGPVMDYTDKGDVWDPVASAYFVSYDAASGQFSSYDETTPLSWLYFLGQWGDKQYPESDPRQSCPMNVSLLCKYSGGPTGPLDKQLNRTQVCPDNGNQCVIRPFLTARHARD